MEKYGFVYLWYDSKRKMFYIGSHWGTEDDGYICSSNRMRNAYKRRPEDFKRKILTKHDNKVELRISENNWLSMINEEELGNKYYNLKNHEFNHWSIEEQNAVKVKKTISERTKEAMSRPEVRAKYEEGLKNRSMDWLTDEVREKKRQSMKKHTFHSQFKKGQEPWNKGLVGIKMNDEHRRKIKEAGTFKKMNNKKMKCNYCDFIGNPGNIGRYHNEKCKNK